MDIEGVSRLPMHPEEQGSSAANGTGHETGAPHIINSGRVRTMDYDTDDATSGGAGGQEDGAEISDMSEMQRLLDEQEVSFKSIKRGDVVEGQIVRIDPEEILVDIGLKSEGVLSTKELPPQGYGSLAELKVGDNVLVYVMQPETPEGHAVVSIPARVRMNVSPLVSPSASRPLRSASPIMLTRSSRGAFFRSNSRGAQNA